ncbi:MAG: DUF4147 domain-containing protein, partial [Planctomycetes bacterium]|nr:DUF4147 domain-containing protein [Planctomycetota bacterium]
GLEAVRSEPLVREHVRVDERTLHVGNETVDLDDVGRIVVVGAGKAGAGMAAGIEQALGGKLMAEKNLTGWINVPADCLRPLERIHLHAARPAGVNEPTEEGVAGSEEILRLVAGLDERDLCLCLLSGGGSALLPAPAKGISLADKQAVTRHLSHSGANIRELNTVRKQFSRIKGGRLMLACGAGRLVTLIISDVIGDPLDVIASGPTVPDLSTTADALAVLEKFRAREAGVPASVIEFLHTIADAAFSDTPCLVSNLVIGNNAIAVDAAGMEAERRGYSHAMTAATELEGPAEPIGRHLAEMALRMRGRRGPDCLIAGGEPTVELVEIKQRGLGGRNQQLALAALERLAKDTGQGIALLSAGTDGEDGPTDAAGALVDASVIAAASEKHMSPGDYLARNDAYHFFDPLNSLIKTGPTHTNVCDRRVVVVNRTE